jgi:hypothetical protein
MVWKAKSAMSLKQEFVLFAGQKGAKPERPKLVVWH